MLAKNFDIKTHLGKISRVSRPILERDSFDAFPGKWVSFASQAAPGYTDGALVNANHANATGDYVVVLSNSISSSNSLSNYEANDTKVGSISTIEEPGVRFEVGRGLLGTGTTPTVGMKLVVEAATGKLIATPATAGTYQKVAKVTAVNSASIEIVTIEQEAITVS